MSWTAFERAQVKALAAGRLLASKTWDPPATAGSQGAEATTTVPVLGAKVGDPVAVGFSQALGAAILQGEVRANDVVTVRLVNTTAAAVDLASGTLTVTVYRPVTLNI
jgi:hypothetical protein